VLGFNDAVTVTLELPSALIGVTVIQAFVFDTVQMQPGADAVTLTGVEPPSAVKFALAGESV
jgi:hypothetical protein